MEVTILLSDGTTEKRELTHIRDLIDFIRDIVRVRHIRKPRVVFSCDAGCGKLIWTMAIYDLEGDPEGMNPGSIDNIFLLAMIDKVQPSTKLYKAWNSHWQS